MLLIPLLIVNSVVSVINPVYAATDNQTTNQTTDQTTGEQIEDTQLINPDKPPFIVRIFTQMQQWVVMSLMRMIGLQTPDELFFNMKRGETTHADKYFGMFDETQSTIMITIMSSFVVVCIPILVMALQINAIGIGSTKNPNNRKRMFDGIVRTLCVALCMSITPFIIGFIFTLCNDVAEGAYNLALANNIEVRPEWLSLANNDTGAISTMLNSMINQLGGVFMVLAILIFTIYFNFYYGMRFFNIFLMISLAPIFVALYSTERYRGVADNYFRELIASAISMPIHAITWTLGCFVMNFTGAGGTFNPLMTLVVYAAIIPQSDIIRGVIVNNDNSSRMIKSFAGMGLGMASTFALMSKANELRGGMSEGASSVLKAAGSSGVGAAGVAGPEGLEPMGQGRVVPFASTSSQATQNMEKYRNVVSKVGGTYGAVSGALAGMIVPGGAGIGAYVGGKLGGGMANAAGNQMLNMGYKGAKLGESNLEEVQNLKSTNSDLKNATTRYNAINNQLEAGIATGTDYKDSGSLGQLTLEREQLGNRIQELSSQKEEQQLLANRAKEKYWGVDDAIENPDERVQALQIQQQLNKDLSGRMQNKKIPQIYEKARTNMENVTSRPAVKLEKGAILFDEVMGNKMRTYAVKPNGERQFYNETRYEGKPISQPQYRVREVLDSDNLDTCLVHTKADLSGYTKEQIQKMDYNKTGFVNKDMAMRSIRSQVPIKKNASQTVSPEVIGVYPKPQRETAPVIIPVEPQPQPQLQPEKSTTLS